MSVTFWHFFNNVDEWWGKQISMITFFFTYNVFIEDKMRADNNKLFFSNKQKWLKKSSIIENIFEHMFIF